MEPSPETAKKKTEVLEDVEKETKHITVPPGYEGKQLRRENTLISNVWSNEDPAISQLCNISKRGPRQRFFPGSTDPRLSQSTNNLGVKLLPRKLDREETSIYVDHKLNKSTNSNVIDKDDKKGKKEKKYISQEASAIVDGDIDADRIASPSPLSDLEKALTSNSSSQAPWNDGLYKLVYQGKFAGKMLINGFTGNFEGFGLQIEDEKSKMILSLGSFDISDKRGLDTDVLKGRTKYSIKMEVPSLLWICHANVCEDRETLVIETGDLITKFTEAEVAQMESLMDKAGSYTHFFTPEPKNQGKIIWVSGGIGTGKSTIAEFMRANYGFVLYEGDAFLFDANPYPKNSPEGPSLFGTRLIKNVSQDRKDKAATVMNSYLKMSKGETVPPTDFTDFYELMCEDIIREKSKIGGNWVIPQAVYQKEVRDFIRGKIGCTFVILDVEKDLHIGRLARRELGEGATEEAIDEAKEEVRKTNVTEGFQGIQEHEEGAIGLELTADMLVEDAVNAILRKTGFENFFEENKAASENESEAPSDNTDDEKVHWKNGLYKLTYQGNHAGKISIMGMEWIFNGMGLQDSKMDTTIGTFDVADKRGLETDVIKGFTDYKIKIELKAAQWTIHANVSEDGENFVLENGDTISKFTDAELLELENSMDHADNYSHYYPLNPEKQGKIIWISAGTGMGKTSTADYLREHHGFVLYEGDAFHSGLNPYYKNSPEGPSMIGTRILKDVSPERQKASATMLDAYLKYIKGEGGDIPLEKFTNLYGLMCEDILRERSKIGGHWVIPQAVYKRDVRDYIRQKLGCTFILLDMDKDLQLERLSRREAAGSSEEVVEEIIERYKENDMTAGYERKQDGEDAIAIHLDKYMTIQDVVDIILKEINFD